MTDAISGRGVYEEKEIYDILSERSRVLAIEHVHELQNLYADEFPDKRLDLTTSSARWNTGEKILDDW
ncbi:hypothetical protein [Dyadobacter sp. CY261]|uniref:hypothetical protein n=1 Tax=Dyadobacter sp. CY261 TaxID=2907203 RepID=UPI001F1DD1D9|nr:hypothetical protein [Dyadobacter sp. CY261]